MLCATLQHEVSTSSIKENGLDGLAENLPVLDLHDGNKRSVGTISMHKCTALYCIILELTRLYKKEPHQQVFYCSHRLFRLEDTQ